MPERHQTQGRGTAAAAADADAATSSGGLEAAAADIIKGGNAPGGLKRRRSLRLSGAGGEAPGGSTPSGGGGEPSEGGRGEEDGSDAKRARVSGEVSAITLDSSSSDESDPAASDGMGTGEMRRTTPTCCDRGHPRP